MKGRKTRNLLLAILTASLVFNIYSYNKYDYVVESESVNPVLVIDELTEQMMLIDPNYAEILDRLE